MQDQPKTTFENYDEAESLALTRHPRLQNKVFQTILASICVYLSHSRAQLMLAFPCGHRHKHGQAFAEKGEQMQKDAGTADKVKHRQTDPQEHTDAQ